MTTAENRAPETPREPSEIDRVAEAHVHASAELDPSIAIELGIPGREREVADLSPAGHEARAALNRATLDRLATARAEAQRAGTLDEVDRVTLLAMRERLGLAVELHEAGEHLRDLNVLASPAQELRNDFDLMPTDTADQWADIAARMAALPGALASYRESLEVGRASGRMPARRQVTEVAQQARLLADPSSSFFADLAGGARPDGAEPSAALAADLRAGSEAARAAYAELAEYLTDTLAPEAPQRDAVGRERYELASRTFLGARVDLEETYEWGLDQLASIGAEQREIVRDIFGEDLPLTEAFARLDADPARQLHGTDALTAWMQEVSDDAIARLDGTMIDIPAPLHRLECKVAPTSSGGIYYTGPSQDFSRPGRMWWAVPEGVTTFSTWQERTTVYHEGVPGHHLQVGWSTYLTQTLNLWRRTAWVSGHGEGWALYAERLMDELGFLPDPADRLGMLDGQRLRAARVCLDIGVHLGLPFPERLVPTAGPGAEAGRGVTDWSTWDAGTSWAFLRDNVAMEEGFMRFEWHRYLGWPGQAPSYKVGQRLWERVRDEHLARRVPAGGGQDEHRAALAEFHTSALSLGSVGLDVLAEAMGRA